MIWIRNAIDEYVSTNLNKYFSREGKRERRTEAQIPILVLYVSLKWLILWRYLDTHVEELSVFEFFMALERALCGVDDTPGGLFAILIQRLWEIDYKFVLCRAWNAFTLSRVSCRALRLRGCSGKLWWVSIGRKFCPWDECVLDYFHSAEQGSQDSQASLEAIVKMWNSRNFRFPAPRAGDYALSINLTAQRSYSRDLGLI